MRILVHDYAGHPFQAQLSRQLAWRGHAVTHAYFAEDPGPKGLLQRQDGDPPCLDFVPISIGRAYDKVSLLSRHVNDLAYGRRAAELVRRLRPEIVLSGNTPTAAQTAIVDSTKNVGARFVMWMQDFYSVAATAFLRRRLGRAGVAIGLHYRVLERRQLRASDAVVVITEDFRPLARAWAGGGDKIHTIENWASLADLPLRQKDNDWSREQGLAERFSFLYTGTIGRRNNPARLSGLARRFGDAATMVVVGQGVAMAQLEAARLEQGASLRLLPLQPAARFACVLGAGDVLVALLEADAGVHSVPSKVLAYLCAGRPILLAAPAANLAARIVSQAQAGLVVDPDDEAGFMAAAKRLRDDAALRHRLGGNGRAYAEQTFDIGRVTDAFERILCARG